MRCAALLGVVVLATGVAAQVAPTTPRPIQDNSFLIEEAYNQEARVVQHILTAEHRSGAPTGFQFTQEWPFHGLRQQLSYSIPVVLDHGAKVGDIALNYRYQLRGDGNATIAVAPRFSLVVPTAAGTTKRTFSARAVGVQAFIPASVVLTRELVAHSNAGVAVSSSYGGIGRMTTTTLGQSLVWLLRTDLNLMLEGLWTSTQLGRRGPTTNSATLAPGLRGAINLESGMQIVPGLAVPIGIGPSKGEHSVFLYFSVEHAF